VTFAAKPAEFTMRTTSSNSNVVNKKYQDASAPQAKAKAQSVKPIARPEVSGMQSDEDDSLEREIAISSPVKGEEYRNSVQVCSSLISCNRYCMTFRHW
jgi:hypothetical protein